MSEGSIQIDGQELSTMKERERSRYEQLDDIVGTIGLALMVAAMLAAMWLRMTSP